MSLYHLPAGNSIPALQLGVYKSDPAVTTKSVQTALENGYKGVDSAQYYANEKESAEAINAYEAAHKENIFITTKIMESAGDVDANYRKCLESVNKIGKAVDLFLIHSPGQSRGAEDRKSIWLALERLVEEKHVKCVALLFLSDFFSHITELLECLTMASNIYRNWKSTLRSLSQSTSSNSTLGSSSARSSLTANREASSSKRIAHSCAARKLSTLRSSESRLSALNLGLRCSSDGPCNAVSLLSQSESLSHLVLFCTFVLHSTDSLIRSDNADRQIHNADVFDFELSDEQMHALDALDAGEHIAPNPVNCD